MDYIARHVRSYPGENLIFSTAVKSFGYGLMTKYMLPLQISGFLLLAAMVGVIVLSKKTTRRLVKSGIDNTISLSHFGIGFICNRLFGVLVRNLLLVLMSLN